MNGLGTTVLVLRDETSTFYATTFSIIGNLRYAATIFDGFFTEVVGKRVSARLLSYEHLTIDATLIAANSWVKSFRRNATGQAPAAARQSELRRRDADERYVRVGGPAITSPKRPSCATATSEMR